MASGTGSIEVAAVTHPGRVRERNEDALAVDGVVLSGGADMLRLSLPEGETHVLLVADGLGGHARGDVASVTALQVVADGPFDRWAAADWTERLHVANDRLFDLMTQHPNSLGFGTTIVGAVLSPRQSICFNVGDSRLYRFDPRGMSRVSVDDVPAWTTVRKGRRSNHQITQSLGGRLTRTAIVPHVCEVPPLTVADGLLLCSDGLTDMLDDGDIARVWSNAKDASECAAELLRLALEAGGADNISIIVAQKESR